MEAGSRAALDRRSLLESALFGSTPLKLIQLSPVPVLVVRT